jgi:hypothetical protein
LIADRKVGAGHHLVAIGGGEAMDESGCYLKNNIDARENKRDKLGEQYVALRNWTPQEL